MFERDSREQTFIDPRLAAEALRETAERWGCPVTRGPLGGASRVPATARGGYLAIRGVTEYLACPSSLRGARRASFLQLACYLVIALDS